MLTQFVKAISTYTYDTDEIRQYLVDSGEDATDDDVIDQITIWAGQVMSEFILVDMNGEEL